MQPITAKERRLHTATEVPVLPKCDIDPSHGDAYADANLGRGWGNVCKADFDRYGCSLGLGKGQRLVLPNPKNAPYHDDDSVEAEVADIMGVDVGEVEW